MNIRNFCMVLVILASAATTRVFAQTPDSLKTTILKVKGINCSMDLKMISSNVEKVSGVSSCKPLKQGTTSSFEVKYNPGVTNEKQIISAVENTGSCEDPDERPYKVKP